ncbi:uncharacterized protein LOC115690133 isoform X2 [Syzygium oleosum]|uniref:uncharacterized protein LOC115690133 isoform X2 n=1 Tax=Syzygium oleosum TaxID=219896 RepID=UPI0011D18441|nr:uncharacterized protein LOC115690133 isoform X2 [Syzygium oleosum]
MFSIALGILSYTPRLVSIDLQGSLGSMSSHGTLYNHEPTTASDVTTWTAGVSTHTAERHRKNLFLQSLYEEQDKSTNINDRPVDKSGLQGEYQDKDIVENLDKGVQFWTDFSKVHYHSQSLYELSGLWMDAWEFDNYGIGRDALSHGLQGEEIIERFRFFVEECDRVQGFQFMVDDSGGFSAVASELLENIADEYSNTPVLLYALRASESHVNLGKRKQTILRSLHDAVSFSQLASFCNLVVPVGLPSLSTSRASSFFCIEDEKPYHCSAIYAAALHSISLPFRMGSLAPTADLHYVSGAVDVGDVVQILSGQSRRNKVAILDMAMPAPSLTGKEAGERLLNHLHPVTPEIAEHAEDLQAVETMTIHGVLGPGGHQASASEVKDTIDAAYEHAPMRPKFCHLSVAHSPLPIPLPFPSIFKNVVGQHGELFENPTAGPPSKGSLDVHSIPMAVRLRSSSAILPYLESRLGYLRRYGVDRGAPGAELVRSWGFGKDDLEEFAEALSKMVIELKPHREVSSDSD